MLPTEMRVLEYAEPGGIAQVATPGRQDVRPARAQCRQSWGLGAGCPLGRSAYIISIKIIINSEVKFFAAKIVIYSLSAEELCRAVNSEIVWPGNKRA